MNLYFGAWVISLFFAVNVVNGVFGRQGSGLASYIVSVVFVALYPHYAQGGDIISLLQQLYNLAFPQPVSDQVILFLYATILFVGSWLIQRHQKKTVRESVVRELAG